MQAYALARPAVRFQLRVQKAKTDRGNFVYAPKTGANVEDAAFKVIGRDCAMQCHWSAMESDGFEVHAFLPKPDAIAAKFSNEGAFISVDSRPLASCRGTSKKMVSLLKTTLHRANPALDSVKNPFFCVNIICPPKSYDPNIEPAKDDVLFEDPDTVLGIVEKLLRTFYLKPNSETPNLEVGTPPSAQIAHDASSLWFNVYENEGDQRTSPENEDQQWRMNMYGEDEEDLHLLSENQPHILEDEEGSRSAAISNPWTIAKMNTPIKPKKPAGIPQLLTPAKDPGEVTITSSSLMLTPSSKKSSTISPLTPQTLSQLNVMQGSVDGELQADIQYAPRPREQSLSREASHYEEDIDLLHQTQLGETPSNVRELNTTSSAPRQRARMPSLLCQISGSAPLDLLQGRQAHTVPEAPAALRRSQRREQNIQNKAFKPPAPASEDLWFGQPRRRPPGLLDSPSKQSACTRLKRIKHPEQQFPTDVVVLKGPRGNALNAVERLHDHLTSENNTDIRDFFGRNTGRRRPSPTALVSDLYTSPTPRKHSARDDQQNGNIREHMRVFAQSEALSQPPSQLPLSAPESDASFSLQDISHSGNATAGPSHPRSRSTASYLRRTRSSKLPLERTPSGYYTQNIILPLSFSVAQLNTFSRKLDMSVNSLEWACPPEEAYDIFATPVMDAKVMEWAEKIDGMLDAWFEREKDAKSVMRFVAEMMQGKLQQRSKEDEEMLPV
jgi:DNA mismatch repair ATPase MutL